ncbi:MAG: SHOCT domain-containing protein [Methanomassiliicoccales archaeon]|nr:SHOCT domain-containing protein [Methanomassiliicoccales archaeon]
MEDSVGEDSAVKAIRPYLKHSASAALLNLKDVMPSNFEGSSAVAFAGAFCNYTMGIREVAEVTDFGVDFHIEDCPFCPCSRTFCRVHAAAIDGFLHIYDLDGEGVVHTFPKRDGKSCRVVSKPRSLSIEKIPSNPRVIMEMPAFDIPDEQRHSLLLQYVSEWWVDATKAFDDAMEPDLSLDVLSKSAHDAGRAHFKTLIGRAGLEPNGLTACGEIIAQSSPVAPSGCMVITSNENEFKSEVSECAFAASPILICKQIEAFYDGACKSIDPGFEFRYEAMMTKGDQKCIWSIKKKKHGDLNAPSDAFSILKKRLARGEISIQEFDEIKKRLAD